MVAATVVGEEVLLTVTVSSEPATKSFDPFGRRAAWVGRIPVVSTPTLVSPETSRRLAVPGSAIQGGGVPDGEQVPDT